MLGHDNGVRGEVTGSLVALRGTEENDIAIPDGTFQSGHYA